MFCLHEEAHKRIFHCASMESKQAKEEGMPALSKKGKWKRARCHQEMPAQQFSHYSKMPGQDGRQTCNACRDLVVPLSCPCRASDSKRLPGLAHNVCNLCAKGFAFAKFSAKRGKRSPRTCALERKKPPLQPISQKQQKRTLSRSNKYHITNVRWVERIVHHSQPRMRATLALPV